MIIRNFLKTAVLGIAFCSTFGVNHSMEFNNRQFHNVINKLVYHDNACHDLYLLKSISSYFNLELESFIENKLSETMDIMERALNYNVSEQDVNRLINNIEDLKNTPDYLSYSSDVRKLFMYSDQIIQEVRNHITTHI